MSDAVFNLANGIDVEEMKQKVEKYKRENQALIMKNRARQVMMCVSVIPKSILICISNHWYFIISQLHSVPRACKEAELIPNYMHNLARLFSANFGFWVLIYKMRGKKWSKIWCCPLLASSWATSVKAVGAWARGTWNAKPACPHGGGGGSKAEEKGKRDPHWRLGW